MGAAAAIVARARRNVISHFMSANAVSAETAVGFTPRRAVERRMLDRFIRAGVVVRAPGGGYFVDVPTYDSTANNRRRKVGLAMAILALVGGAAAGILG